MRGDTTGPRILYGALCALLCACGEPAASPAGSSSAGGGGTASSSSGASAAGGLDLPSAGSAAGASPASAGAAGSESGAGTGSASGGNASSAGRNAGGSDGGGTSAGSGASNGGTSGAGSGGTATSGGSGGDAAFGVCAGKPAKSIKIYMIGDSTMSVYTSDLYPRMGWGQPLGAAFEAKCATVLDRALSGRSSKSFYDEGAWTPVKNALAPGDYVLIQFGHNDEKRDDAARYTEPQTTYKQYLTTYVNETRAKSAIPLLLTSINRNSWNGNRLSDSHGAYPPAVRELAASLQVELIDLTTLTKAYFERIGQTETSKLFLVLTPGQFPNYPDGVTDSTHLQEQGALKIGQLAMADAYAQKLTIASYLKAVPVAP